MFRPVPSHRLSMINLATGGTRGFTYDAAGNVTAEARPGGTYGYTYNAAGRMSEFRINGILQASYRYDAMGRQAIRTLSSPTTVTIHSVFDSQGRRIAEYNQTSGALIREYVWNGWDPIAVIEGGVISFVRADHIGRPVFATNSTGVKVWSASYHPFGGVHTSTGAPPSARFPGQWFQSESGLHQNWMRDYDPTTGRYLQADPLGLIDGASVYGYAGQSPMMNMDPTGECYGPAAAACAQAAAACFGPQAVACAGAAAVGGAIILYLWYYSDDICDAMWILYNEIKDGTADDHGDGTEDTPSTNPDDFKWVKGTPAKENKKTGEFWEKDKLHKDHWEVYKDRKAYEKGRRNRDVWDDGRPKRKF